MFNNRPKDGPFPGDYRQTRLAQEVENAYQMGRNEGHSRSQIINQMAKVIAAQVARGEFLSDHLRSRAADIRTVRDGMTGQEAALLESIARVNGAKKSKLKKDHLHLEF